MQFVQKNLCVRLFARAFRLLAPLLVLSAADSLRAEVIYGPFLFQQESLSTQGVYNDGWQVSSEPMTFTNFIFKFNDPMLPVLYSSPNPLPNANDHGLPEDELLFLGPSLSDQAGESDILYRVASNGPNLPGFSREPLGRLTFATTGAPVLADTTGFANDLYDGPGGAAGDGKWLATNFAADYLLTAADFANESQQAVLYYDPMNGDGSALEGQFTGTSGYVGFRFQSITAEDFYGWLHITNITNSVSNSGGSSIFGFVVDSFAIRAASGTEPAGIQIGSTTPGMFSAVPEPGTYGVMLVLGAACGLRAWRRRVASAQSLS